MRDREAFFRRWVEKNPLLAEHLGAWWSMREIDRLRRLYGLAADRIAAQSELLQRSAERTMKGEAP